MFSAQHQHTTLPTHNSFPTLHITQCFKCYLQLWEHNTVCLALPYLSPLWSRAPDGLPSPVSPLRATLRVMSWPAETANIKLPRTNHSTAQLHCSLPVFVPTPWWPNLSEISKTFDWIPSCPLFRYRYFISLKKVDFHKKKSNSILDKRCAALPHFVFVIFCNDLFNSMKVCPP